MSSRARIKPKPPSVTVVAKNADTVRGLRAYFDESGVPTHGTQSIRDLVSLPPTATAVVLFPDDFAHSDVSTLVSMLRRTHPDVLVVLVTREARKLEDVVAADGQSRPPLVLPRPSFGWSILDAIRAHGSRTVTP